METVWCPYGECTVSGTEAEVDEHRTYAHRDEPQAGSNLHERSRDSRRKR